MGFSWPAILVWLRSSVWPMRGGRKDGSGLAWCGSLIRNLFRLSWLSVLTSFFVFHVEIVDDSFVNGDL